MARRPSTFKQHDFTRALRGAIAAGIKPQRAEIEAGKFVIIFAAEGPQTFDAELDQELAEFEAKICGST